MSDNEGPVPHDSGQPTTTESEPAVTSNEGESPEHSASLMGRIGRAVAHFDETLSDRVPDAIEGASRRTADSARKGIQSGRWQNYAFLAVLALVAITVTVLLARGCSAGVMP
jgi:hypothetical protein